MHFGHSPILKKLIPGIMLLFLICFSLSVFSASPTPVPTPTPILPEITAGGQGTITVQDNHGIHTVTIRNLKTNNPEISWGHHGYCPGPARISFCVGLGTRYQVYYEDCQKHYYIWETSEILNDDPHEKPAFIKEGEILHETPKPEHHWWDFLKTYGFNMWSILVIIVVIASLVVFYIKRRN